MALPAEPAAPASGTLSEAVHGEALGHLQALLRLDTTNPPGDEYKVAEYVAPLLEREGIPYERVEPAPGRVSLIARLSGSGARRPLLLSSHADVVPAEPEHWQVPPFSGEIVDGCVWGRGAVDMKSMTAYGLVTLLELRRRRAPLTRDVILSVVADEEAGSGLGMRWIVEHRPELVDAEYALNEVGGFTLHMAGRAVYPVQVAEKGIVWMRLTARGQPGHGSLPDARSSVARLARALRRLTGGRLRRRVTPSFRRFVYEASERLPWPQRLVLRAGLLPGVGRLFVPALIPSADQARAFTALLYDTASPTVLRSGEVVNVIPSEASVLVDGRTLPGTTTEEYVEEVRRRVGPDVEVEVLVAAPPAVSDPDTPLFELIREVVARRHPGAVAVPAPISGFTDSKWLIGRGTHAYGFAPVRLPPEIEFMKLFHGHDERIPVEGFRWGLETFYEVVERFATG